MFHSFRSTVAEARRRGDLHFAALLSQDRIHNRPSEPPGTRLPAFRLRPRGFGPRTKGKIMSKNDSFEKFHEATLCCNVRNVQGNAN